MGKLGTLQEKEHTQSLEKRVQGVLAARVFYSDTFPRPASVCQVGVQAGAGLGFVPPTSHAGPKKPTRFTSPSVVCSLASYHLQEGVNLPKEAFIGKE